MNFLKDRCSHISPSNTLSSMSHEDSFFLKDKNGNNHFDPRLFDTETLKNHLILHPVNLLQLKDSFGRIILHCYKYDDEFIKYCVYKWPIAILNIKDVYGRDFLYYHSYSDELVDFCNKLTRAGGYVDLTFRSNPSNTLSGMFHESSFFVKNKYGGYYFDPKLLDTETLKKHLTLHPVNPFYLRDSFGRIIFDYTVYDDDFIEWCLQKWSAGILNDRDVHKVYYYFNISYIEDLYDYVSLCNNPHRLGACSEEYIESLLQPCPSNFFECKNDPEPEDSKSATPANMF